MTAEAIHKNSSRSDKPFVSINCGAPDEDLLLDELLGHVKGAFTEARTERKGAFLAADGGALFMDEIANASLKVQQALLRAIAMRKISPGLEVHLNQRQQKAHDYIPREGKISRVDHQHIIGNGLPRRTAQNDLQDMVKKGVLERTGRVPSIRYRRAGYRDPS